MLKLLKKLMARAKIPFSDKVALSAGSTVLCAAVLAGAPDIVALIFRHRLFDPSKHFAKKNLSQSALAKAAMCGANRVPSLSSFPKTTINHCYQVYSMAAATRRICKRGS